MMNDLCTDIGYSSLNKKGEQLCGDHIDIVEQESNGTISAALADGLGSGVKANILSTMTARILTTMIAEGAAMTECVETMMEALPVCREREMNYCTFTMVRISPDGSGVIFEYDNPQAILYQGGKCRDFESEQIEMAGKTLRRAEFHLEEGDAIVVVSDGVLFAGPNQTMNYDWQRPHIMKYLDRTLTPERSATASAAMLAGACMDLYCGHPGDDTTVAVISLKPICSVSLMIGPPADRTREKAHVKHFLEVGDLHAVCGGTTGEIVADYLGKEIFLLPNTGFRTVPPYSVVEGLDLVTEGALTIAYLTELSERHLNPYSLGVKRYNGNNGAEKLAKLLFEQAAEITCFVGKTVNIAHAGTRADSGKKRKSVETLCRNLRRMGKNVVEIYH